MKISKSKDRKMSNETKYHCKNCNEKYISSFPYQKLHCDCGFIVWRENLAKNNKQTAWAKNANRKYGFSPA